MAAIAVLAAAGLAVVPAPDGVTPATLRAAALCLVAVAFWGTGVVAEHITALGFFLLAILFAVAPPEVVFAGFQSAAFWLVVGGLIIGAGVERTGLGGRIAGSLMRLFGGSYLRIVFGLAVVGVALSFLMPSTMGRVLILVPIVNGLAGRLGFARGSRGRNGMILAATLATFMPSAAVLPSNVANMVLAGSAETLYGVTLTYGHYLYLHFPVTGLAKALAIVAVTWLMFREVPRPQTPEDSRGRLSPEERRLAAILAGALVLWITDFAHGINPAWVAVGAALLCLAPRVGMLPASAFNEDLRPATLFYVAAILGLGRVMAETGVGDLLARGLIHVVDFRPGADAYNYGALAVTTSVLGLATTVPGVPAVLGPLADDIAAASGLPLFTVLMTFVVGFSNVVLPYQLSPLVVSMQLGGVRLAEGAGLTLAVALIGVAVLMPLNYFWWRLIGFLG